MALVRILNDNKQLSLLRPSRVGQLFWLFRVQVRNYLDSNHGFLKLLSKKSKVLKLCDISRLLAHGDVKYEKSGVEEKEDDGCCRPGKGREGGPRLDE